jgi:hypothetical protein
LPVTIAVKCWQSGGGEEGVERAGEHLAHHRFGGRAALDLRNGGDPPRK